MTALTVILCIVLFFVLLLLLRIRVVVAFNETGPHISLKILGIKIPLFPRKAKWKMKKHLPEYIEKKELKKQSKKEKKQRKKEKKFNKAKAKNPNALVKKKEKKKFKLSSLPPLIRFYSRLLLHFLKKFGSYLRIDVYKLKIVIATGDAAKTAITYGEAISAVGSFLAFLDQMFLLKIKKEKNIKITADFAKPKIEADIEIAVSFTVRQLFAILFSTLFKFLKLQMEKSRNEAIAKAKEAKKSQNTNKSAENTAKQASVIQERK